LQAQAPLPPNYTTLLTNDSFKIIRVHYGPHEKVPVHDHPDVTTVYVYLNNSGPVNIIHDQTPPNIITRPPTHTGAFRVSRGRIERHAIENLSDLPSDFLRVELPTIHLGDADLEFRGPAPASLAQNLDAAEFSSPHVAVTRIVCVQTTPCAIPPSTAPSVLIGLADSTITTNNKTTTLGLGSVMAVQPNQSLQVTPTKTSAPAHLLQVFVQFPANLPPR
ncbi:hypothetical protein, partial [Granulicella sp. S190]|uniref:hypothetical protein n=1 Tax=Granulicella sp. S190 TaxID=1747226 RepID=UPI00131C3655